MCPRRKYTQLFWQPKSPVQKFSADLQSESGRKREEGRDVISMCCMNNDDGNVVFDAGGMKTI